jgi:transcriptional regulator with XRE-family HTH domain
MGYESAARLMGESLDFWGMKAELALKKIGARLREVRRKKGHSSYEYFAYEYDLNKVTVGKAEKGENIKLSTLLKIMEILEISPEEFFKGIK